MSAVECLNHLALLSGSLLELLLLSLSMLCLAASTRGTHSRGGGLVTYKQLLSIHFHFLFMAFNIFNVIFILTKLLGVG